MFVLALVGQFVSMKYGYDQRMKELEQAREEASRRGRPADGRGKAAHS